MQMRQRECPSPRSLKDPEPPPFPGPWPGVREGPVRKEKAHTHGGEATALGCMGSHHKLPTFKSQHPEPLKAQVFKEMTELQ